MREEVSSPPGESIRSAEQNRPEAVQIQRAEGLIPLAALIRRAAVSSRPEASTPVQE
jgi:hypothetical protein